MYCPCLFIKSAPPCHNPLPPQPQTLEDMRRKGEEVPADPFDSNCITPGTGFMDRLGHHLRFFIRRKKAEDPLWQAPVVVFSGAHLARGWSGTTCASVFNAQW